MDLDISSPLVWPSEYARTQSVNKRPWFPSRKRKFWDGLSWRKFELASPCAEQAQRWLEKECDLYHIEHATLSVPYEFCYALQGCESGGEECGAALYWKWDGGKWQSFSCDYFVRIGENIAGIAALLNVARRAFSLGVRAPIEEVSAPKWVHWSDILKCSPDASWEQLAASHERLYEQYVDEGNMLAASNLRWALHDAGKERNVTLGYSLTLSVSERDGD